ncbi:O-antigen translocase [Psychrobacillus sp. FSL K6-1415]|uniref:O-antigen translocase n=1 Tax=Psychrobacillus sp. FSL K6-1415 TaxID=2921544 RepID=UPI0030F91B04
MNFFKTSLLSGLSTVIKLLSGLIVNKVVAVYIGPAGIALIGQFQNFLSIITTFGNGAISSGVTKYVAEFHETDIKRRNDFISASFIITFIFSVICGVLLFLGSSFLSEWILKTVEFSKVFKLLGITLILISFNIILLSIINGIKKIKLFIAINICSSILSLFVTSFLTIFTGLFGALLSMIIVQSIVIVITLPLVKKKLDLQFNMNIHIEKEIFKKLLAFSLMAIVSVLSVSISQIAIRNHLIKEFSLEEAGRWQSVWMISTMYLMVMTTAFSTYYLPKLSELQESSEIRKEIFSGYKIILPFTLITALMIYFLRDFIITILFTPEFIEMRSLFAFQLIGDFLKMTSWSLAFLMIAKAMTKTYIITEIICSISFYIITIILTKNNGLIGVTQAYALNYLAYLIIMIWLFKSTLFKRSELKND